MKRKFKPTPGTLLGVIAIVMALAGTAYAAGSLRLSNFEPQSRNVLAGTGVIQYAAAPFTTGETNNDTPQTFVVKCELSKKATSGGFKWTGQTPPKPADYKLLDAYPNGSGFQVRMYILGPTAEKQPISLYSNCVKSRAQRGLPPN
jgi:hypothetical protein